ncbi:hypothetical protein TorRG33x02_241470 [Trema orientale]|uniref:Uncharacterized protein n=1 Tax=Trema orientale TaxID=63057 RepID=A0A2P5DUI9_TREOI|nr:hypothetical protein TorRG33x02_241470 [Trema orientale]
MEVNATWRMNQMKPNAKHLGLPIFYSKSKVKDFKFLLERIESKMAGWKVSILSKVGRFALIKSVAASIPAYTMMTLPIPKKTCTDIDASLRDFWWGKYDNNRHRGYWKAWDAICTPRIIWRGRLQNQALAVANLCSLSGQWDTHQLNNFFDPIMLELYCECNLLLIIPHLIAGFGQRLLQVSSPLNQSTSLTNNPGSLPTLLHHQSYGNGCGPANSFKGINSYSGPLFPSPYQLEDSFLAS